MNSLKVRLKPYAFPKMLAELSHSNQFLKVFAIGSLLVSLGLLTLVFAVLMREPIVIALSPDAYVLSKGELPNPESEIRAAISAYIERRYNWDKENIDQKLDSAKALVASDSERNFVQGLLNVKRFSKEKGVSQRAYPSAITVDLKKETVRVAGDRITEIQGVRAAGPFTVEFTYQGGPRSAENPWGVFITRETER